LIFGNSSPPAELSVAANKIIVRPARILVFTADT